MPIAATAIELIKSRYITGPPLVKNSVISKENRSCYAKKIIIEHCVGDFGAFTGNFQADVPIDESTAITFVGAISLYRRISTGGNHCRPDSLDELQRPKDNPRYRLNDGPFVTKKLTIPTEKILL